MSTAAVIKTGPVQRRSGPDLQIAAAFFAIYVLWGSTYYAIRVLVATVPPLFAAGVRFSIAGTILFLWTRTRGVPNPSRVEWRSLTILGALMFLGSYSGLFWAEKTIPSGIAALLVATIPVWTALLEIFVFRRERLRLTLVVSILLGIAGVAALAFNPQQGRLTLLPCLAILGAEMSWSLGTVLSKGMDLPRSKTLVSGVQMMTGGAMLLLVSAAIGELRPRPHFSVEAVFALLYLIVAGSLIAFTAFVWLLSRMPVTVVSSYAYVNPVVALAIGAALGHEVVGWRTLMGGALVLSSVLLIARGREKKTGP